MTDHETIRKTIEELHATYVRMSGIQLPLMTRDYVWFEWVRRGLTPEDLAMLIRHIKSERAKGNNVRGADLKFRNLVGNVDYAEEDILELRARRRGPRVDQGRAAVLRASGRPAAEAAPEARSAGDVAAQLTRDPAAAQRAFEEFQKLKQSL